MKQISFKAIEKKLEKKNLELMDIRESRRKLDDKEKEICAAIEKLQNQKVEVIFEEVKKENCFCNCTFSCCLRSIEYQHFT